MEEGLEAQAQNAVEPLLVGITVPKSPYTEFQRKVFSVLLSLKNRCLKTPRLGQRSFNLWNYFASCSISNLIILKYINALNSNPCNFLKYRVNKIIYVQEEERTRSGYFEQFFLSTFLNHKFAFLHFIKSSMNVERPLYVQPSSSDFFKTL